MRVLVVVGLVVLAGSAGAVERRDPAGDRAVEVLNQRELARVSGRTGVVVPPPPAGPPILGAPLMPESRL